MLIDRVTEIIPGEYAYGTKYVTINDWFFSGQNNDDLAMPQFLIAEALGQLLNLVVLTKPEYAGQFLFSTQLRAYNGMMLSDRVISLR